MPKFINKLSPIKYGQNKTSLEKMIIVDKRKDVIKEDASLTRRKFLQVVGVGAVASSLAAADKLTPNIPALPQLTTAQQEAVPEQEPLPVARSIARLTINRKLCTMSCRRCELVCSLHNVGVCAPVLARLRIDRTRDTGLWETGVAAPEVCYQCDRPGCLLSCPKGAIKVDAARGTYARVVDKEACEGCVYICGSACPFKMVFSDYTEKPVAIKCTLCGGDPECVKVCPTGAIQTHPEPLGESKEESEEESTL